MLIIFSRTLVVLSLFLVLLAVTHGQPATIVTTKIIDNGPDTRKKVFAVVSEGYSKEDMPKFAADVDRLVTSGILGHDLFLEYRTAFNAYRVDLVSNESGMSTPSKQKDTALQMVYTGDWNRCWMEETNASDVRLRRALSNIPRYDYALVVLNESGFGGCRRGTRLYVTSGVEWDVVSHEYGHGVGNLFDEYWTQPGVHPSSIPVNDRNCSSLLDKNRVAWKDLLDEGIVLPPSSDLNGGPSLPTVGMFRGCNYKSDGIYRPSHECRMKSNSPEFCPVCRLYLKRELEPFVGQAAGGTGGQPLNRYLSLLIEVRQTGETQVLSASEIDTSIALTKETFGNYVLEITKDKKTSELLLLSQDPFEVRSFADPNNNRGEKISSGDRTTFLVNIPNTDFEKVEIDKLGLKIHELRSYFRVEQSGTILAQSELLKQIKSNSLDTFNITSQKLAADLKLLPKNAQF